MRKRPGEELDGNRRKGTRSRSVERQALAARRARGPRKTAAVDGLLRWVAVQIPVALGGDRQPPPKIGQGRAAAEMCTRQWCWVAAVPRRSLHRNAARLDCGH